MARDHTNDILAADDERIRVNFSINGSIPGDVDTSNAIQRDLRNVLETHGVAVGFVSAESYKERNSRDMYELPPTDDYTPRQVRNQLFDRVHAMAVAEANAPGVYTTEERCLRVAHGVLDIIDAKGGNKPDGEGLPLFQLLLSPHPEYTEARKRQGLPVYDNSLPFDTGLVHGEYNTGLARAFAERYDTTRAKLARSAVELFD